MTRSNIVILLLYVSSTIVSFPEHDYLLVNDNVYFFLWTAPVLLIPVAEEGGGIGRVGEHVEEV